MTRAHPDAAPLPRGVTNEVVGRVSPAQFVELNTIAQRLLEIQLDIGERTGKPRERSEVVGLVQRHVEESVLYGLRAQGKVWFSPREPITPLFASGDAAKKKAIQRVNADTPQLYELHIVEPMGNGLLLGLEKSGLIGVSMEVALGVDEGLTRRLSNVRRYLTELFRQSNLSTEVRKLTRDPSVRKFNLNPPSPNGNIPDHTTLKTQSSLMGNLMVNRYVRRGGVDLTLERDTLLRFLEFMSPKDGHKSLWMKHFAIEMTDLFGFTAQELGIDPGDIADFIRTKANALIVAADETNAGRDLDGDLINPFHGILYFVPEMFEVSQAPTFAPDIVAETHKRQLPHVSLNTIKTASTLLDQLGRMRDDITRAAEIKPPNDVELDRLEDLYGDRLRQAKSGDLLYVLMHMAYLRIGRSSSALQEEIIFDDAVSSALFNNPKILFDVLEYAIAGEGYITPNARPRLGSEAEFNHVQETLLANIRSQIVDKSHDIDMKFAPLILSSAAPAESRIILQSMHDNDQEDVVPSFAEVPFAKIIEFFRECEVTHRKPDIPFGGSGFQVLDYDQYIIDMIVESITPEAKAALIQIFKRSTRD